MKRKSEFKIDDHNIRNKKMGSIDTHQNLEVLYNTANSAMNQSSLMNKFHYNKENTIVNSINNISNNFQNLKENLGNFTRFPQSRKDSKSRITTGGGSEKDTLNLPYVRNKNHMINSEIENPDDLSLFVSNKTKLISKLKENMNNKYKNFKYFDIGDEDEGSGRSKMPVTRNVTEIKSEFLVNSKFHQPEDLLYKDYHNNMLFSDSNEHLQNNNINMTPNLTIHKIHSDQQNSNNTQIKLSNPQSVFTFKGDSVSNANSKNVTSILSSFKMSTENQKNLVANNSLNNNVISNYYPKKKNNELCVSSVHTKVVSNISSSNNNNKSSNIYMHSSDTKVKEKDIDDDIDLDEFFENNNLNDFLKEEDDLNKDNTKNLSNSKNAKNSFMNSHNNNVYPFPLNKIITHEKLNPIQENCLHLLFNTDLNSLITAPTGSGKTVLFEMAISRIVGLNFDTQSFKFIKKSFKIVYLAPIKSLCQEKFFDWKVKFSQLPFDLSVVEATGDSDYINISQLINANIILSTPERWDVITRKWKDYPHVISSISLFLIDEIHLLNEEQRGATLEAIIARMKLLSHLPQFENSLIKNFRIIALSATIPNLEELAEFLEVDLKTSLKKFGDEYRPVKIEKLVFGYNMAKNEYLFEKYLNYRLADAIAKYSDNRPSLVFCQTQKGTINAANQLLSDIGKLDFSSNENQSISAARFNLSMQIKEKQLSNLVKNGIAFHNAGLCVEDRQLIEENFKKGILKVICTTSTLAQGVNLPARLVIIKSTYCYRGPKIGYNEYNKIEIDQMIGRAGRPQYDNKGIAIIMTEKQNVDKYIDMTSSTANIESHLSNYIIEHINAEITLGTITDVKTAVKWLKNTFMYVRMKNNPEKFGIKKQINTNMVVVINNHLEKICMKMFEDLENNQLILLEEENTVDKNASQNSNTNTQRVEHLVNSNMQNMQGCSEISQRSLNSNLDSTIIKNKKDKILDKHILKAKPKSLGKKMSKYYVYFETLKKINNLTSNTEESILEILSNSHEFSKYTSKMEDRKTLNNFNKDELSIKYKIKGPIDTFNKKAYILLQAALGGLNIDLWELRRQQNEIVTASIRILNCIKEYFKMKNDAKGYLNSIIMRRSLIQRMWNDNDYIIKQLPKIGDKLAKNFVKAGINSFEKLINENPRKLEAISGRIAPFGNILIDIVKSIPLIEFKYEILKNFKNCFKLSMVINLPWRKYIHQEDFDPYTNYHLIVIEISSNQIIFKKKIKPNSYNKNLFFNVPNINKEKFPINVHLICDKFIGLDRIISIANADDKTGTVNNYNASGQMTLFQLYGEKIKNTNVGMINNKSINSKSVKNNENLNDSRNVNQSFIESVYCQELELDNEINQLIYEIDDEMKSNELDNESRAGNNSSSNEMSINKRQKGAKLTKLEKISGKNNKNNKTNDASNTTSTNNNQNDKNNLNLKTLLDNMRACENTNKKNKKPNENIINTTTTQKTISNNNSYSPSINKSHQDNAGNTTDVNQEIMKFENTDIKAKLIGGMKSLMGINDKTPPREKNKKLSYLRDNTTAYTDRSSTIVKTNEFDLDFLDKYEFKNDHDFSMKFDKAQNEHDIISTQGAANKNVTQTNNRFKLNFDELL